MVQGRLFPPKKVFIFRCALVGHQHLQKECRLQPASAQQSGLIWMWYQTDKCYFPLPEKLAWMVASEFTLDAAIKFKLGCRATK
jgi:hypothetical protein